MGERLHLQPIQAKAMDFLKAEIMAGRTEALGHKDSLEKLSHEAHAEILSLFRDAKIMPAGPGTSSSRTSPKRPTRIHLLSKMTILNTARLILGLRLGLRRRSPSQC